MGGQEINIIVTVKNLEELVFQVAPIKKDKLEEIRSLRPGKVVVKSHVECESCQQNMEVNFFWTHALTVSEPTASYIEPGEIKVEYIGHEEELKMEQELEDDDNYEEEYLIEESEESNVQEMVVKEEEVEIDKEDPPEKKLQKNINRTKPKQSNKFDIPNNALVKRLEANEVCDYCTYKRRRPNCILSRTNFLAHCASHLILKDGPNFNCRACGMPTFTISDARHHALVCEERVAYKEEWKRTEEGSGMAEKTPDIVNSGLKKKYHREKILCHICSKEVIKYSMAEHMLKHESGTSLPFECNECGRKFGARVYLRKHLVVCHFPDSATFKCPLCPAVFVQKTKLTTHQMAKHKIGNIEKVTCSLCGIIVANERNLKEHHFNAHTDPSMKQKYPCLHCNKVFYDKRHHKTHVLIHLPEDQRPFKCENCGKGFVNSYKWKQHMLEHKNPDLLLRKCEICGKGYKYANSLKVHMRVHTGEQPYECKFCQRRFADRSHHRVHMKGHESEMGIKLTLTAEERRLVNHGVYQPEELISQVVLE